MVMGMMIIPTTILILAVVVVVLIGHVRGDLAEDTRECQDQLVGLAPCLDYAGGTSKAPSPICCTALRQKYSTTERCLCLLVKDRNDPGLGFKINATLALSLPYICHAPGANVSDCPKLLHLAPDSPDAQVFEDFARSLTANTFEPISGNAAEGARGSTTTTPKSSSASVKGRWATGITVLSIFLLVISVFM